MTKYIKLNTETENQDYPILEASLGRDLIDFSNLSSDTKYFIYDPGFKTTASCKSKICFIDGEKGQLLYRGYPIEQLASQSTYIEICYLLLFGEMPDKNQFLSFEKEISSLTDLPKFCYEILDKFPKNSHPMSMLNTLIASLAQEYDKSIPIEDPGHREKAAKMAIAKMPILVALCICHSQGKKFFLPKKELSFTENFLYMLSGRRPSKIEVDAIDCIFTLHAEHEQNASTSTVRAVASTGANPFACITAGSCALWGPLHGGANEAAIKMLQKIGSIDHIDEYIDKAKDKNDPFRLMGFGHRVYKNYDPRAKIIQSLCKKVLEMGHDDPLFPLAQKLETTALNDQYFVDRKLFPNVDFYSGIIQKALGIPSNCFTTIFALSRTSGWMSHWLESHNENPKTPIVRPRQCYIGKKNRSLENK